MGRVQAHTLNSKAKSKNSNASSASGFTLIETTVALVILTISLLALAGAISYAVSARNKSRNVTDSKLLIVSVLEQMENLRNTKHLTFGQIANAGDVNSDGAARVFAGFPTNFQVISTDPGNDGIYGTTDDPSATARPEYTRQILITPLPANGDIRKVNLKKIKVTLRYPGQSGATQELVGVGYLNNDAHSNYIK